MFKIESKKINIIKTITNNLNDYSPQTFPEMYDLVIYYHYLSVFYEEIDNNLGNLYDTYAKKFLEKILTNVKHYDIPMGSWYGFTGLAYVIREIYGNCALLNSIEKFIQEQSLRLIINGKKRDSLFNGQYDVLNGLTGMVAYFMRYRLDQKDYIIKCLKWMINLFDKEKQIKNSDKLLIKNAYITNPIFKKEYPEGYIDLGVSHGIIDFLYVFSLAKNKGIECENLEETYNKILNFYLSIFDKYKDFNWPQLIYVNGKKREYVSKKRFGWCYGKLGVIRTIYCIAKNTHNMQLEKKMISEIKKININDLDNLGLECPTFCHGYSAVYLIASMFYNETKDIYFKKLLKKLEEKIWSMGNKKNKFYFYKYDRDYICKKDIYEYEKINSIDGIFSVLIPYFICKSNYQDNLYTKSLFLK